MAVVIRNKKGPAQRARRRKIPSSSLHSQGVAASVNERVEDLVRRYPALASSLGSMLLEGKKRIRDFPQADQVRLLRMILALKKASGGRPLP
jgi:hypothetical protein